MEAGFNYLFDEAAWKVSERAFLAAGFARLEMERQGGGWGRVGEFLWGVSGAHVECIMHLDFILLYYEYHYLLIGNTDILKFFCYVKILLLF